MIKVANKVITYLYCFLFFLVPLVLYPNSSELFEFNKMVLTYSIASLIMSFWIIKMVVSKKIIFKKTYLDIPLIIFLISQLLSTLVSIDKRTSFLGYYSRFHGGLASSISYSLLYWAYVANMNFESSKKTINSLLISSFIVSIWGILEHFGHSLSCLIFPEFRTFDVSCWVQDVQHRVFATLGQPNWLATWLVALSPIMWALTMASKVNSRKFWISLTASLLLYLTILYTKSRSGLLAFTVASFCFWISLTFLNLKKWINVKKISILFFIFNISFLILTLISGTPWTPPLNNLLQKLKTQNGFSISEQQINPKVLGPALEVGGTESGQIRKIVWQGAIEIWKNYPILGSGVETFALSYYNHRPLQHNLVSEWDYLYNKAHNEYLNFAATTGSFGLASYLFLIGSIIYVLLKELRIGNYELGKYNPTSYILLPASLLAGFSGILISNFFGFSVVPVAIQFFLYPAMAVTLKEFRMKNEELRISTLSYIQKSVIVLVLLLTSYLLLLISRYWYSDYLFAQGKLNNDTANYSKAREYLIKTTKLSPNEAVYWIELSESSTSIANAYEEDSNYIKAEEFSKLAISEANMAETLSSKDVNIKRRKASLLIKLSPLDQNFLILAKDTLNDAVKLAPTDAKLYYNLALSYLRTGDYENAIRVMKKTAELKPNYADAHYALALMYIDVGEKDRAKEELKYILREISPNDARVKRELEELGP